MTMNEVDKSSVLVKKSHVACRERDQELSDALAIEEVLGDDREIGVYSCMHGSRVAM